MKMSLTNPLVWIKRILGLAEPVLNYVGRLFEEVQAANQCCAEHSRSFIHHGLLHVALDGLQVDALRIEKVDF